MERRPLTLSFTWGGGTARVWAGTIRLLDALDRPIAAWGQLRLLSIEKDAPGSVLMDPEAKLLKIRSLHPSTYHSFQVECGAGSEDLESIFLEVDLHELEDSTVGIKRKLPLVQVINGSWNVPLDDQGNGLWVERPAEDRLRFAFPTPVQICQPETPIEFQLLGSRLGGKAESEVSWQVELIPSSSIPVDSGASWQDAGVTKLSRRGDLKPIGPLAFVAPKTPGVYELVAKVDYPKSGVLNFAARDTVVRRFQFVVLGPREVSDPSFSIPSNSVAGTVEISPEQLTNGWPRLTEVSRLGVFPRLNSLSRAATQSFVTAGSSSLQLERDDAGVWMEIGGGQWRTVSIPAIQAGQYLLEVQYRNPSEGRLAVTVLQGDRWGDYQQLQTGVGVWENRLPWQWASAESTRSLNQLCWINESAANQPITLVLQNSGTIPVSVGKIQFRQREKQGQPSGSSFPAAGGEFLLPYRSVDLNLQTPLLATVFQAPKRSSQATESLLNDWNTIVTAVKRVGSLMKDQKLGTLWLPVFSQGGSIYPGQGSETSLRYENSGFSQEVQFDQKLDVVELLLSQLATSGLKLTPVFDFSGTLELVELNALRQQENVPWRQSGLLDSGGHYNPLHPLVQQSIREIVVDFLKVYRKHAALEGLAINLGHESQLLFTSAEQGLHPEVVSRFLQESGIVWPTDKKGELSNSTYDQRVQFIIGEFRDIWLEWRAKKLTAFFNELSTTAKQVTQRPDFELTLILEDWLNHPAMRAAAFPNLRNSLEWESESLRLGVDLPLWNSEKVDFRVAYQWGVRPADSIVEDRLSNFQFHRDPSWRLMKSNARCISIFQDPLEVLDLSNIPTANGHKTGMQSLVSYVRPQGRCEDWSEILWAFDAKTLMKQSWGSGAAMSAEEIAFQSSFTQLPRIDFQTVFETSNCGVVARQALVGNEFLVYLVNAAPWDSEVLLPQVSDAEQLQPLSEDASERSIEWKATTSGVTCQLPANSLAVFRVTKSLSWKSLQVQSDERVVAALNEIKDSLFRKLKLAGHPKPWPYLQNPDFEEGNSAALTGWTHSQASDPGRANEQIVERDDSIAYSGRHSLHVRNDVGVAWIRSQQMTPVSTGRISVAAWMRMHPNSATKSVRLSIDGETQYGEKYYRFAEVRLTGEEAQGGWQPVAAHFDDVPETGLVRFRVGVDLMGPGEFWLDSVHCFDRWFDATDQKVLSNRLGLFAYALENRENAFGAYQMLNDYWLNFLYQHFDDPVATAEQGDPVRQSDSDNWPNRTKRRLFNLR